MPILEVPDAFQIEVMDGWEVNALPGGHEYTLAPGGKSELSLTLRIYPPRPKSDNTAEARTLALRTYAKTLGVEDVGSLTVLTPSGEQPRAFASIDGEKVNRYLGFLYFKKAFVLAVASASTADRSGFSTAEQLIWSITPG